MKHNLRPLPDQVVVVTGASSGIGLVTARLAAAQGAAVVLAARNTEALEALAAEITGAGGRALAVTTDVGRLEDVERLATAAVAEFGRFDTWVNNAGVSIYGMVDEVSVEDMHRMFDTNYWGVVHGSRAALAHYRGRADGHGFAGAIVNVGSVFGDRATPVQSTYSSSKHAVHGWTDAMRMDMEAQQVPVSVTLLSVAWTRVGGTGEASRPRRSRHGPHCLDRPYDRTSSTTTSAPPGRGLPRCSARRTVLDTASCDS